MVQWLGVNAALWLLNGCRRCPTANRLMRSLASGEKPNAGALMVLGGSEIV
jgi:hypothetical protein